MQQHAKPINGFETRRFRFGQKWGLQGNIDNIGRNG